MNRSEMKCVKCIKFDGRQCRLSPAPIPIDDPEKHWCAQGQWHAWSDRYEEMEPYFWGEWEQDECGSAQGKLSGEKSHAYSS
ncbi:MAG: hypothetical protein P8182_12405 [Deltaproteobacteria bacterium]